MSIECKTKTTLSDSISIKKDWLEKIKKESLFDGKRYYSLAFNFGPNQDNYYIIDSEFNLELAEDMKFKIEHIKKSNSYVLYVNDRLYNAFDSLSSVLKSSIEDYFNEE